MFILHLRLLPHLWSAEVVGVILMFLSLARYLFYLSPFVLQRSVRGLATEEKAALLVAHLNGNIPKIAEILSEGLGLKSSQRLASHLARMKKDKVERTLGIS